MDRRTLPQLARSLALVFCLAALALPSKSNAAWTFSDAGFFTETVATLPAFTPVAIAWAPDGRLFIATKEGTVRVVKNGTLLPTPFIDISSKVNQFTDRGLLGIAIDPNYAANGYVYLAYVYEGGGNPNSTAVTVSLVSRVTSNPANTDVALTGSETILVGSTAQIPCPAPTANGINNCLPADYYSHQTGTLKFGADGKLWIAYGDGASYNGVAPLAMRSLNVDSLAGKILRINPDGTAPADNPFYIGANNARSKVWAYGLRNPFRFSLHPLTGVPIGGDVGFETWEEINRIERGANFGWPCYEGNRPQPLYQAAFPTECGAFPPSSVTPPLYEYFHDANGGTSAIGGTIYQGNQYPTEYASDYFFADYTNRWIRRMRFDANGNLLDVLPFAGNIGTTFGGLVALELGPDGYLYYVEITTGIVGRIRHSIGGGANEAPTAAFTANPTSGYSPLTVQFSSSGSTDPEGLPLSYSWNFGDGTTSTLPNPEHTYTSGSPQTRTVSLIVTDNLGLTASTSRTITVGSTPPNVTIASPAGSAAVTAGTIVNFSGSATDAEDGQLPASSLSWTVLLHHNTHVHVAGTFPGAGGSLTIEPHDPSSVFAYEFILTATDSSGLTAQKSVTLGVQNTLGGPIMALGMNEGSGTTTADLSGNSHTGTLVNGPTWGSGQFGTGIVLDGSNDSLSIAAPQTISLGTGDFTVMGWFKRGALNGVQQNLFTKCGPTTWVSGCKALYLDNDNALVFGSFETGNTISATIADTNWHHVAVVFSNSSDALQIFVDGALTTSATKALEPDVSGHVLTLGNMHGLNGFSGTLDEWQIFARPLTSGEILAYRSTPIVASGGGSNSTIKVRARGFPAGGIGPNMQLRLNGNVIGAVEVASSALQDYNFSTPTVVGGDRIDVVFTNDAIIGTEDRNLIVDSVTIGTTVILPTDAGVTIDKGTGAAAFDGLNVIAGQTGIWWDAALRMTMPGSPPTDTTAPTVSVTAPAAGASVSAAISVSATASDNVGVAGVQFLLDGSPLGSEDTVAPYTVTWDSSTATNGAHTLSARARDAAGNQTTSATVSVTVANTVPDTTAPTVSLTAPAAGTSVSAAISVSATASDNVEVAGVQFLLDGSPLGSEDTVAPYTVTWDSSTATNGAHTLSARARDAAGNQATSPTVSVTVANTVPDTTAPSVSLTAPATGTSVSAAISVSATASDNVEVAGVQFLLDGSPLGSEDTVAPYTVTWDSSTATNGAHTLSARARDAAGNQTTSPTVSVTVANTVPDTTAPSVSLTAPATGTSVSAAITVSATASDNVEVAGVQFLLDGTALGSEDTVAPYTVTWDSSTATNGAHTLSARARDAAGNQTTSPTVSVTVANTVPDTTAPSVSLTAPAAGASVSAAISVSATASDNVEVAGVQFLLDGSPLGSEDTVAPYTITWDSSTATNGAHTLSARARDAAGNQTTSPAVSVTVANTVPDTTAPSVSLTAPAAGASVSAAISVSADASDNVEVAGVQFLLDGSPLGSEDTVAPYTVTWDSSTATNGAHTLSARARDAAGNQTTSPTVSVTVANTVPDTTAPSVSLTAPAAGASVSAAITVSATASDNVEVAGVQFLLDGTALGSEDTVAPYTVTWDSSTATNGAHTLSARARDAAGNQTTSPTVSVTVANTVPDTTAPSVSLTAPAAGASVSAAISVSATASDNVEVAGVQFLLDGSPLGSEDTVAPYTITWDSSTATNGAHTLSARARDAAGNQTTSPAVSVTVANTVPDTTAPSVSLTAPAAGASVSAAITVSADASDNVEVAGVQFLLDGSPLGSEDTVAPYTITWDSSTATNGAHTLSARARDAAGNQTTSPAVSVTVANTVPDTTAPSVSLTAPAAGASVSAAITVSADASDNVEVAGVQFLLDGSPLGSEDTVAPYTITWDSSTATNGAHTLSARARDAAGNQTTSPTVSVTVANTVPDTTAPSVSLTAPAAGTSVSAAISVSATASDNVGVTGVQFLLDGSPLGSEDTAAPYTVSWNTTTASNGVHTLSARARDAAGNQTTSPTVSVTVANSTSATVIVRARGTPAGGINPNMQLWLNGTLIGSTAVTTNTLQNYNFTTPAVLSGDRIDVAFTNDATIGTEDRNLIIDSVTIGATVIRPTDAGVTIDRGSGSAAFDGVNVIAGQTGLWWDAALRMTMPGTPPPDTTAPSVSLTAPAAGASVSAAISVSATASDNVGVAGVQFLLDGNALGSEDTVAPYTVSWNTTTASNGAHTLSARARDAAGNQTTSPTVSVTVANTVPDTTAPTVSVTAPAAGTSVSAAISVSATASDNVGVAGVQFLLDGSPLGSEDTVAPYTVSWNTATASNGAHTLSARARDAAGNQTTSPTVSVTVANTVPDTIAPSVSLTAPAAGTSVSAAISVSATASDNVGVAGVQFLLDGNALGSEDTAAPYTVSWNTTTASNGVHTLSARARDAAGNQTTSPTVSVTVANSTSATVIVRARGTPAGGINPNMQLWLNGTLIGSTAVTTNTLQNYNFTTPAVLSGDRIDVAFTNDATIGTEDRNLIIDSVTIGATVIRPTDAGVTIDRGSGSAAFDGVNVIAGQTGLWWDAALRMTMR